jgi:hypothetical protein
LQCWSAAGLLRVNTPAADAQPPPKLVFLNTTKPQESKLNLTVMVVSARVLDVAFVDCIPHLAAYWQECVLQNGCRRTCCVTHAWKSALGQSIAALLTHAWHPTSALFTSTLDMLHQISQMCSFMT